VIAYKNYRRSQSPIAGAAFQPVSLTRLASQGTVACAALSPDGEYVAYAFADKGRQSLGLLQIATSTSKEVVRPAEITYDGLTCTPDGRFIYYVARARDEEQDKLYRISTDGGVPTPLLGDILRAVHFSPDGKQIAFIRSVADASSSDH